MKPLLLTFFAGLAYCLFPVATADAPVRHTSFKPGEIWTDNNGVHINAHGGGILVVKDAAAVGVNVHAVVVRPDFSGLERRVPDGGDRKTHV